MIKKIIVLVLVGLQLQIGTAQTPNWQWARGAGSTGADYAIANDADANGNNYTIGWYTSANITFGSITLTNPGTGTSDLFVTKHDANGNTLWAKTYGGADGEIGSSIVVDTNGDAYITGWFTSPTITFGSVTLNNTSTGSSDVFVVKINTAGNVVWAKSIGGNQADRSNGIEIDVNGNVYITGSYMSTSINFGASTVNNTAAGNNDIFVAKFDNTGNNLWAKSAGGTGADVSNGIAVDATGNVYITGAFSSAAINFGIGAHNNSSSGTQDLFLAKYNTAGSVQWSVKGGGNADDYANAIKVSANAVYFTGGFASATATIGNQTLNNASSGTHDILLAKYDLSGNALWSKREGGSDTEVGNSMDIDAQERVFVAGYFTSANVNIGGKLLTNAAGGYRDIFISTYDANGLSIWATSVGDAFDETANGISVNAQGNTVMLSGVFNSSTLLFGTNAIYKGCGDDVFVSKMSELTLGNKEELLKNKLELFPNPAANYFIVETKHAGSLQMLDALGKIIYTTQIALGSNKISLKNFDKGVYFIQLNCNTKTYTGKLVVE